MQTCCKNPVIQKVMWISLKCLVLTFIQYITNMHRCNVKYSEMSCMHIFIECHKHLVIHKVLWISLKCLPPTRIYQHVTNTHRCIKYCESVRNILLKYISLRCMKSCESFNISWMNPHTFFTAFCKHPVFHKVNLNQSKMSCTFTFFQHITNTLRCIKQHQIFRVNARRHSAYKCRHVVFISHLLVQLQRLSIWRTPES